MFPCGLLVVQSRGFVVDLYSVKAYSKFDYNLLIFLFHILKFSLRDHLEGIFVVRIRVGLSSSAGFCLPAPVQRVHSKCPYHSKCNTKCPLCMVVQHCHTPREVTNKFYNLCLVTAHLHRWQQDIQEEKKKKNNFFLHISKTALKQASESDSRHHSS